MSLNEFDKSTRNIGIKNWFVFLELISLSLNTVTVPDNDLEENGMSLMSDLLFRYALMKMAELRNLWLYKKFKV